MVWNEIPPSFQWIKDFSLLAIRGSTELLQLVHFLETININRIIFGANVYFQSVFTESLELLIISIIQTLQIDIHVKLFCTNITCRVRFLVYCGIFQGL